MRKTFLIVFFGFLLLINSCTDPWNDRFTGIQDAPDKTVWEILKSNPDYSGFVNLLNETGYDTILQRNTVFSVYVPVNSNMGNINDFSAEQKKNIAAFHISNGIIYSNNMEDVTLRTLSGKCLNFVNQNGTINLNYESTVTKTNIQAKNGVIHEISSLQTIKPNLFEFININTDFSYISDYFENSTTLIFDEANSIPVGIDEIGQTIYDSVFIYQNDFFTELADISSEEDKFTMFLAGNTLLDTTEQGKFKSGYISNIGNFTVQGVVDPNNVPSSLTGVTGVTFSTNQGDFHFLEYASNGAIYEFTTLKGLKFPYEFTWEITDISEFDTVRYKKSMEYVSVYETFTNIKVSELTGGFNNFKYEILSGPLNKDYFKIAVKPGTYATITINLPDIIPGTYNIILHAQKRASDGAKIDCYFNNDPAIQDISLNGGLYTWEDFSLGEINVTKESGNVLKLKTDGSNTAWTKLYMDYFTFEPAN